MIVCGAYDVKSGWPCDRDALHSVLAGCVHEHVGQRDLCGYHLADLSAGLQRCGDCAERGCQGCKLTLIKHDLSATTLARQRDFARIHLDERCQDGSE